MNDGTAADRERATRVRRLFGAALALIATVLSSSSMIAAQARSDAAERAAYRSQLSAAVKALGEHDLDGAAVLLAATARDLRGWEYRYLSAQLDPGPPLHDNLSEQLPTARAPERLSHETPVQTTACTPCGAMILSSAGDDGSARPGPLRIWDAHSGSEIARYGGPAEIIDSLAVDPTGRYAVLGVRRDGGHCSTRVLDLSNGEAWRRGPFRDDNSVQLSIHPDGRRVLTSFGSGLAVVWDLHTGEPLWSTGQSDDPLARQALHPQAEPHPRAGQPTRVDISQDEQESCPVAIAPDGRLLALALHGGVIRLIDADDHTVVRRWQAHDEEICSLTFSPNSRWLLSTSRDDTVGIWDVDSGRLLSRLSGHDGDVLCASVCPDGSRIASGGRDKLLRLWDTEHFENLVSLPGHEGSINTLTWSSDGTRLASGGDDGDVRLWEPLSLARRVAARRERAALLPAARVRVGRALAFADRSETSSAAAPSASPTADPQAAPCSAWASLQHDSTLSARERELTLQAALAFAFDRAGARRSARGDDQSDPLFGGARPDTVRLVTSPWGQFRCAVSTAPDDEPSERRAPAWYRASRASGPLVIDGHLDEADWRQAPWTEPFVDIEGAARPAPRQRTRVRMVWDDQFLYVAAILDEHHVWGTLSNHDAIIYRDNDFEVFLDPDGDGLDYGEVEINALGTVFDLLLDKPYEQGGRAHIDWTPPGLQSAVSIQGTLNDPSDEDRGWTVELAIPHRALAGAPASPRVHDVWRVNFSRVQWRHEIVDGVETKVPGTREDNWVWTPQFAVNMHRPRHWGFVEFGP